MDFFDSIFRLLDAEQNCKYRIASECIQHKGGTNPPAHVELGPCRSAAHSLLLHCAISCRFGISQASEKLSSSSSADRAQWKCTSLPRHSQLNEQSVLTN